VRIPVCSAARASVESCSVRSGSNFDGPGLTAASLIATLHRQLEGALMKAAGEGTPGQENFRVG